MPQIHQFDFRGRPWPEVADTLCGFRGTVDTEGAYAYLRTSPGSQLRMVERLVRDLGLDEYVSTEEMPACG